MTQYPEVQVKLRTELVKARENVPDGIISPDEIFALPYLDAVCVSWKAKLKIQHSADFHNLWLAIRRPFSK